MIKCIYPLHTWLHFVYTLFIVFIAYIARTLASSLTHDHIILVQKSLASLLCSRDLQSIAHTYICANFTRSKEAVYIIAAVRQLSCNHTSGSWCFSLVVCVTLGVVCVCCSAMPGTGIVSCGLPPGLLLFAPRPP